MAQNRTRPLPLILIGVGVVALAVVLALTTTGSGTNSGGSFDLADYETPGVQGDDLPVLQDPATDPARGTGAPSFAGEGLDGQAITFEPAEDGPAVLLFLAHWCPHCQREVPVVQDFVEAGRVPDGVQVLAVATGIDENRPNYPPDAWLEGEDWNVPTIVDTDGSLARAFGLSAYPYWVVIDEAGEVDARFSGNLGEEQLAGLFDSLAAGG